MGFKSKLKAGIFNDTQIRELMKDHNFIKSMTAIEASSWNSFVLVVQNFPGNHKSANYEELVQ